jgi:hypothetical protein
LTSFLGAASLLFEACSSEPETEAPPASPDVDAIGQTLTTLQCARTFECCGTDELQQVFSGIEVDEAADCENAVGSFVQVFFVPQLRDAIEQGRVAVRGEHQAACESALASLACADFNAGPQINVFEPGVCRDYLEPLVPQSGFCSEDWECVSGFCSRGAGAAPGSCKAAPKQDEACPNDRCDAGLECTEGVCVEQLADGEACARDSACVSGLCAEDAGAFVCTAVDPVCAGS